MTQNPTRSDIAAAVVAYRSQANRLIEDEALAWLIAWQKAGAVKKSYRKLTWEDVPVRKKQVIKKRPRLLTAMWKGDMWERGQ